MTERRGDEEKVLAAFSDCLHWMINEGLIRVEKIHEYDGGYDFVGIQLTAAGITLIRQDTEDPEIGGSIETRVNESGGDDLGSSIYTKIGEFVGGAMGGLSKSLGSG